LRKISLKYDGTCIKCGRRIPAGEDAYWERDKGVWHLDCSRREGSRISGSVARGFASKGLWAAVAAIVILAFVLGGLVLAPIMVPKSTVTMTATVTTTTTEHSTALIVTTTSGTTTATGLKWINPSDQNVISWEDAAKYVGQTKTVEGIIVRTYKSAKGTVFLNFHDPYKGYFYAVIFSGDLKKFPFQPEAYYLGKEVRVTGKIQLYEGSPEIIVKSPSQIEVAHMGFDYP